MTAALAIGLLLLLVAAASPLLYEAWRRLVARGGNLQIWRAMQRQGLTADDIEHGTLARAVRRCVMCPSTSACDTWLASGKRDDAEDFCPNARLLAHARSEKDSRNMR